MTFGEILKELRKKKGLTQVQFAEIFNFIDKMSSFHGVDITEFIPQNFLTLAVTITGFNENEIRAKYPADIAQRLIDTNKELSPFIQENNNRFAICVKHDYYITKNKDSASALVCITSDAEQNVRIVKELKNPNNTHKYTCKTCCNEINKRLEKLGIEIKFNSSHFGLFCKYYGIKNNESLCYITKTFSSPLYSYSLATIDFIVDEIKKDPEIIRNLKQKLKK